MKARVTSWTPAPGKAAWDTCYPALVAFKAEHGHLDVPAGLTDSTGRTIKAWITMVRANVQRGTLSAHKTALLMELGVDLRTGRHARTWQGYLDELRAYINRVGDDLVPYSLVTESGLKLGRWVHVNRRDFAKGTLSDTRIAELEAIGFDFSGKKRLYDTWESCFPMVENFAKKHGHLNFPASYVTPSGKSLGSWFGAQLERLRAGKLTPECFDELAGLPIRAATFDVETVIADAEAFYGRFGHIRIHETNHARWRALREAVVALRLLALLDKLPQKVADRVSQARLGILGASNATPRAWRTERRNEPTGRAERWEGWFEQLATFRAEHGHIRIPYIQEDGRRPPLYSWLHEQKALVRDGQLDPLKRVRLEGLGVKFKDTGRAAN